MEHKRAPDHYISSCGRWRVCAQYFVFTEPSAKKRHKNWSISNTIIKVFDRQGLCALPSTPAPYVPFGLLRLDVPKDEEFHWAQAQLGERLVCEAVRNFHNIGPFYIFDVKDHPYALISLDYHGGYGVLDLISGAITHISTHDEQMWIWCDVVEHDPVAQTIVGTGCYWAAPSERVTFDFSDPLRPPYAVLDSVLEEEE